MSSNTNLEIKKLNPKDLHNQSLEELKNILSNTYNDYIALRTNHIANNSRPDRSLRIVKKNVARLKTIICLKKGLESESKK